MPIRDGNSDRQGLTDVESGISKEGTAREGKSTYHGGSESITRTSMRRGKELYKYKKNSRVRGGSTM